MELSLPIFTTWALELVLDPPLSWTTFQNAQLIKVKMQLDRRTEETKIINSSDFRLEESLTNLEIFPLNKDTPSRSKATTRTANLSVFLESPDLFFLNWESFLYKNSQNTNSRKTSQKRRMDIFTHCIKATHVYFSACLLFPLSK